MSLNHDGCRLTSIVQFFFIEKLTDHVWKVRSNPKGFTIGEIGKIVFTMEFLTAASAIVPLASSLFINMLSINVGEFFFTLVETVICGGEIIFKISI